MSFKAVLPRSDALWDDPKSNLHLDCDSQPSTPRFTSSRPVHTHRLHEHAQFLGLLTPVASQASLSPSPSRQNPVTRSTSVFFQPSTPRTPTRISIRRPIPRSPPTLALSLHVPPASDMTLMSRSSSPPPRPVSPRADYIQRPPSRSECLLRDTLRRVEQHERHQVRASRSPMRRQVDRQRKDSYIGPIGSPDEFTDGECECDEDPELNPTKRVGSFDFLFRAPAASAPRATRRRSSSRTPPDVRHDPYGSPSSPSPLPPAFVRTRTAPTVPSANHLASRDSIMAAPTPHRPRHGRPLRHSMPNTANHSDGTHSHTNSIESSPPTRPLALSPHEAVLRARLEGVLQRATVEDSKAPKPRPTVGATGTHGRSKSHSVSIVGSPGANVDWSYVAGVRRPDSMTASSPSGSGSDLSKSRMSLSEHDRYLTNSNTTSPLSPTAPITPPPTPPFNARTASEVCKRMDGYVSFASIEGLGEPPGMEFDGDEACEHGAKWTRWLRVWPFGTPGTAQDMDAGAGSRSESQERPASR